MRLGERCLAFLLTCSLLLGSPGADAGFMAQDLHDRVDFLLFIGRLGLTAFLSPYLESKILGKLPPKKPLSEGGKKSESEQLDELDRLWELHEVDFQIEQVEGIFELVLFSKSKKSLRASLEQLQAIVEIAPGLAPAVEAVPWFERAVNLPVSETLLELLVRLIKGEDLDTVINRLSVQDRVRLTWEAKRIKCEKLVSLLKQIPVLLRADGVEIKMTSTQLQRISEIAPGLTSWIEASRDHEVLLPVSGTMLTLLAILARDESPYSAVANFETDQREKLASEAKRIDCEKIESLMRTGSIESVSSSPRSTSSPRTTPTSSPRSKKTNDNSHIVRRCSVENQQHSGRERRHSITAAVFSDLPKLHRKTEKKEKRKKKELPIDTEPVSVTVTEDLISSNATPLEQLLQYSSMGKDNSNICHYCPLVVTDEELVKLLKTLGFKSKEQIKIANEHLLFAQALVTGFAEQGFPNGTPSGELLDVLRWILEKYNGKDLREKFETKWAQAKGYSLDDEFVNFLKTLGFKNRAHVQIASEHLPLGQALVSRLAEKGVKGGPASTALVDVLRWIWENYKDAVLLKEYILSQISVSVEALNSIFEHTDSEIAAAWTQSNVGLFRNLKPQDLKYTDSEGAVDTSFTIVEHAANNAFSWLSNLLRTKPQMEKAALSKRLLVIADMMLKMGDYHGALTIHRVLQSSGDYVVLQKTHRKLANTLVGTFKQSATCDFEDCKNMLTELRSSAESTFLSPLIFYQSAFLKLEGIGSLSKRIAELGAFLQMIHNDKSKAPRVENVNPDLLKIFMKLAFLDMNT